jgi:hypothetical protein
MSNRNAKVQSRRDIRKAIKRLRDLEAFAQELTDKTGNAIIPAIAARTARGFIRSEWTKRND